MRVEHNLVLSQIARACLSWSVNKERNKNNDKHIPSSLRESTTGTVLVCRQTCPFFYSPSCPKDPIRQAIPGSDSCLSDRARLVTGVTQLKQQHWELVLWER